MAFVLPPPPPRRGFGWRRRVAKNPDRNRNQTGRPPRWGRAESGPMGRGPAWVFRFYLFTFRVWSSPSYNLLFPSYVHYSFSRSFGRPPPPPPCRLRRPQPNPTMCQWTTVPVSRNCTNYNIKLLFTLFEDTNPFGRNVSARACVHCCLLAPLVLGRETLPTPAVMTLSPVSLRRRSTGPVCAADTNTRNAPTAQWPRTRVFSERVVRRIDLETTPLRYIRFAMSHRESRKHRRDLCRTFEPRGIVDRRR